MYESSFKTEKHDNPLPCSCGQLMSLPSHVTGQQTYLASISAFSLTVLRCLFCLLVGLPALLQVSDRDLQIGLSSCQLFAALRENRWINMLWMAAVTLVQSICWCIYLLQLKVFLRSERLHRIWDLAPVVLTSVDTRLAHFHHTLQVGFPYGPNISVHIHTHLWKLKINHICSFLFSFHPSYYLESLCSSDGVPDHSRFKYCDASLCRAYKVKPHSFNSTSYNTDGLLAKITVHNP